MADFDNDLFISFAHADNRDHWVDEFHASLQHWPDAFGIKARIWRDVKLRGDDIFSDVVLDELKRSALLVSIVSPNGMQSNWCEKERQKFEQFAESNSGFRVGGAVRAFKVIMMPAANNAHQDLFGTLGYEFFEVNAMTGRYEIYLADDPRFKKRIMALAQDIKARLEAVATVQPQPSKVAIFVAPVTSDLEPDRTKIVDQLTAWGYRVLPSNPLPMSPPELRTVLEGALREAVLSVHLFSDKRGAIPDNEEKPLPVMQYEMASDQGLERIVWILPGVGLHQTAAKALEDRSQGSERIEKQTVEDLKEILAAKLNGLEKSASAVTATKLNVYVVCDRRDNPFSNVARRTSLGKPLKGHSAPVVSVSFSNNGKLLASASKDQTVRIWDVEQMRSLGDALQGHTENVSTVAFSPDSTLLASAGADRTVRLWDVSRRQPLGEPLQGHAGSIASVAFSPDGKLLASAGTDRTVRIWVRDPAAWAEVLCRSANRNLSAAEWEQYLGSIPDYHRTCAELPPGDGIRSNRPD